MKRFIIAPLALLSVFSIASTASADVKFNGTTVDKVILDPSINYQINPSLPQQAPIIEEAPLRQYEPNLESYRIYRYERFRALNKREPLPFIDFRALPPLDLSTPPSGVLKQDATNEVEFKAMPSSPSGSGSTVIFQGAEINRIIIAPK